MKILELKRSPTNSALAIAALVMFSYAAQSVNWMDTPLEDGVFYVQLFDFDSNILETPLDGKQDFEFVVNITKGGPNS